MASLVLGVAGAAVGSAIGGSISVLGATVTAAQIGGFVGSLAGQLIDRTLLNPAQGASYHGDGPRLSDVNITSSSEGAPIPRIWGRARVGGQVVWQAKFKETVTTTTTSTGGGKGFGGGGGGTSTQTSYSYSCSFAVAFCEGEVTRLGRVWADGKELDLAKYTTRFYKGREDQLPDALIEQVEGTGNVPAFRGLAYLVFENFPLAAFGNRIPQMQFEINRALQASDPKALDNIIQGVALIPGSGEFILATDVVTANDGQGGTQSQNRNNNLGTSDFIASLDQLEALLPNCRSVVLVVAWFGDDLRCGNCLIKPKVEIASKTTTPLTWKVNGIPRASAAVMSLDGDGRPVFGGTPSDDAVVQAIHELKVRGYAVQFYPFLMMDIPAVNTKADPYSDDAVSAGQPAFPWRGRITCAPAAGYAGTVDKTASAASQVASFFGSAAAGDFHVSGTQVSWIGGNDWGLRRMVLHYAKLCKAAGGVDAFLLASELEGLTKIRSASGTYPAVAQLVSLAGDVKAILPGAQISYAANWTEFSGHRPEDGSGDVYFHLDPFWSSADVDFVAFDNYMPLSDWRDGASHADYEDGRRITDLDYLDANVEGGELYDWHYLSQSDRDAQNRTAIADPGGYGEDWVYRIKDIRGWWENLHYDRPGGVRTGTATAWVPQSKPIVLTELGCPAVDKGSNQPNVFVDAKSSESAFPCYSHRTRDDLIQRRALEAAINHWDMAAGHNPVSSVYDGPMIDPGRVHVWCWDARSFPDFPARATVWTDTPNWQFGHWLNGRIGLVPLNDLVANICAYAAFDAIDVSDLVGLVTGFVIDRTMSVREALEPLMLAYQFDAVESDGVIKFLHRGQAVAVALTEDDLAIDEGRDIKSSFQITRAQETDLPLASRLTYIDASADYRQAAVESRRLVVQSQRTAVSQVSIIMEQGFAQAVSDCLLQDAWVMRERAAFALPPSHLALDAGDVVTLQAGARDWRFRISEIADAGARALNAVRTDPFVYAFVGGRDRGFAALPVQTFGAPLGVFLDLPILSGTAVEHAPYFAAYASPWPGSVLLYRAAGSAGFSLDAVAPTPARIGALNSDFYSGPLWRFDRVNELYLTLGAGSLESRTELDVLNGANALALENGDGEWELIQFEVAELIGTRSYKLSNLLRGLGGTEGAMRDPVSAGARVVILDAALTQPGLSFDQRSLTFTYRYGPPGVDFSDDAYVQDTRSFSAIGLRPFAPTGVRGRRNSATGDWTVSWKRRTRIGGDDWEQSEVPLGETGETYDVEIYDTGGTILKRTATVTSPSMTYTAAQQTSDFGAAQWNFTARVYQRSDGFGRGPGAQALIWHY